MSYRKILISLILLAISGLGVIKPAAAAGNSLYLTPASKTVGDGSTFSISVRANSTGANAVQANLSYPTNKLTYLSTSYSGSAFEIQAESSGGGGSIRIGRGTLSTVSGDKLVATISFRATVSSGSAVLTFSSGSVLVNNGVSLSASLSGATIQLTTPPAASPPPVVDKTPPVISDINVSSISQNSAVISWSTNEEADSLIEYGLDTNYGLTIGTSAKTTKHQITLSSSFLTPKTTFHYRLTSSDASGNKQVSPDHTFITAGIPVTVISLDKNGNPLSGVSISVDGQKETTDKNGAATFQLGTGSHLVAGGYKSNTQSQSIILANSDIGSQNHQVKLQFKKLAAVNYQPYFLVLLVFLVGTICGAWLWRFYAVPLITSGSTVKLPWLLKWMPVSKLQRYFGDANAAHNPYFGIHPLRRLKNWLQNKQ